MILSKTEIYSTDDDSLIVRDEAFYERVMALRRDHRNLLDSLRACHAALEAWVRLEQVNPDDDSPWYETWLEAVELTKAAGVEWPEQGEEEDNDNTL